LTHGGLPLNEVLAELVAANLDLSTEVRRKLKLGDEEGADS